MTKVSIAESERKAILELAGVEGEEDQKETKFNFPRSMQALKEIKDSSLRLGPKYTVIQELCKGFYAAAKEADKADGNSWLIKIGMMIDIANCNERQAEIIINAISEARITSPALALYSVAILDIEEKDAS